MRAPIYSETTSVSPDAIERWSEWALAEADRTGPVKTGRFLDDIEEDSRN
ncbi:MAG: hypothetical protein M3O82_04815 [Verrucomicrobiota bacterium]|jgi:hypothetical protein|nr:hypothetical protein [Verrucomicrobiota bacterium]